ncbi:MAG: hypothetical protein BWK73_26850 [Thiothrix lacustris]|uniref:Core-binding (CB) domain-containing protein n=1 Tax=Thiothrix lacustris TaxID=525917 RepID=A0A1Y1QKJ9_9GAMM|nr:MAG: hypothetical protein BWK73_26850 [Thiothrix lacustris]
MGRNRTTSGEGLPPNLYRKPQAEGHYYQYRDPRSGKFHGLGYDRKTAISQATQLNALIAEQQRTNRVTAIYQPKQPEKRQYWDWSTALNTYHDLTDKRETAKKIAENTAKTRRSHINALRKLPNWQLDPANLEQMIADTAAFLDSYRTQGKDRTAQSLRTTIRDVFIELRHLGQWLNPLDPGTATRNEPATVKRSRLELEQFWAIIDYAKSKPGQFEPWFEHAMLLAITTSHCNAELNRLTYHDTATGCHTDNDWLYITREKVDTSRIKIPLDFRLEKVGKSIRDIIAMTRSDGIQTPFIIHHQRGMTNAKRGDPVHPYAFSRRFAAARDALGITPEKGKTPVTFYEIRSLCQRLAREQGIDTQTLMGHKQASTTEIYNDPRGGFIELQLNTVAQNTRKT